MIPADGTALDLAVRRLERAVAQLEQRQAARAAEVERALAVAAAAPVASSSPAEPGLFDDEERVRLVADLEAARERERALEEAGEQASAALGRAIAEIRSALGDEFVANDDHAHDDEAEEADALVQDDDLFDAPKAGDPKVRDLGEA
ncbi:hypothetical protein [Caulobacter sp. FWC2]|uniref:hypothetical protein n=1 Tax=Caulobacter sp. FWC2 TaxID=69664 RepID=UPI000C1577BC|nr:hypothetical protein [Caulobacter sp. FWC2]PIB90874.1 hypothetical protein CSW62_04410 [Caulobacter sp. FWC2]